MSRQLLALSLFLLVITNPVLANDNQEKRVSPGRPTINKVQVSGTSIYIYGNRLLGDRAFFAAESSSEMVEVPFIREGNGFIEVMLPYEPTAGIYRVGLGRSQNLLRVVASS